MLRDAVKLIAGVPEKDTGEKFLSNAQMLLALRNTHNDHPEHPLRFAMDQHIIPLVFFVSCSDEFPDYIASNECYTSLTAVYADYLAELATMGVTPLVV